MTSAKEAARAILVSLTPETVTEGQAQVQAYLDALVSELSGALDAARAAGHAKAPVTLVRTQNDRWKGFAHRLVGSAVAIADPTARFQAAIAGTVEASVIAQAFALPKSAAQIAAERAREAAKARPAKGRDGKGRNAKGQGKPRRPAPAKTVPTVIVRKESHSRVPTAG